MFLRRVLAAAVAGALLPATLSPLNAKGSGKKGEPEGGRIAGRVFVADGKTPVAGAVVRAVPLQGHASVASAPSDAKGEFTIAGLPFGYFDFVVEAPGGTFVASQVVNVPPEGKLVVRLALTPYADKNPSWWAGREPRVLPGGEAATGVADLSHSSRGAAFWKSPGGIATVAGIGGLALLAIAAGGGSSASTSAPIQE